MTYSISIPHIQSVTDQLGTELQSKIAELQARYIPCSLDVEKRKDRSLFLCHLHEGRLEEEEIFRQALAMCLAAFFYDCWELEWMRQRLHNRLPEALLSEACQIEMRLLTRRTPAHRWQQKLAEQLEAYLGESKQLAVDGFMRFRFYEYRQWLEQTIQEILEEYILDKEYKEFIQLLRYFVSVQTPTFPLVHVIHQDDGRFRLYKEDGTPLHHHEIDQTLHEIVELTYSYEDYIVSALLSTSPEQVILHTQMPEANVIRTLVQIFEERISLCSGCAKCAVSQNGGRK